MKKVFYFMSSRGALAGFLLACALLSCALLPGILCSCASSVPDLDFRQEMRGFVIDLSEYAKGEKTGFIIIPQNGQDLATTDGEPDGPAAAAYLAAIDGQGREDLFYGYDEDDAATAAEDTEWMSGFLDVEEEKGVEALVTDYCSTHTKMDDSYAQNVARGYTSLAADSRDLDRIPAYPASPYNENSGDITSLAAAENFLYLLDPSGFASKDDYLNRLAATNYDLIIMDLFYEPAEGGSGPVELTPADLAVITAKANGGSRLLICYMSIGEAEDYRFYWEDDWSAGSPEWIEDENPNWEGNYKVRYWDEEWQAVIFGREGAYLDKIIAAGFDGVYLDIIDAFEYFEE